MTGVILTQVVTYDFAQNKNGVAGVINTPLQIPRSAIIVNSFSVCLSPITTTGGNVFINVGSSITNFLFLNNFSSANFASAGSTSGNNNDFRYMDNSLSVNIYLTGAGTITGGSFRTYIQYYFPEKALGNIPYIPSPPPGGIGGGGTLNHLAKFTPDGSHIGDSSIIDNGVNVLIGETVISNVDGIESIDTNHRGLFNHPGNVTLDWNACRLVDPNTGQISGDWNARILYDPHNRPVFEWWDNGITILEGVGFFGAVPIPQQSIAIPPAAFVSNTSGIVNDSATFGGYTLGQIVAALQAFGLLS